MTENKLYNLITFASNRQGNKIFCRFTCNKSNIIKGFYDFDKELFFITHIIKSNLQKEQISQETAINEINDHLLINYDWILNKTK